MASKVRILSNVFINTSGNKLKLNDIIFDEKIVQIIPKLNSTVNWDDISTKEKLSGFVNGLQLKKLPASSQVIDGEFLLAMPGGIDSHVHFNTPGFENRDDFEHGSLASASGGTTTIIDMPCTSIPPVTSLENFQIKLKAVKQRSIVDFAFWGGISGNDFTDGKNIQNQIEELAKVGVTGFKAYLHSGMNSFRELTKMQMQVCASWIANNKKILAVHAEDKELITNSMISFQREGRTDWRAYCQARDESAEAQAITNVVDIAKKTGCKILVVHLSSRLGLNLIRKARKEGLDISAETCPHYLYFTQKDFENRTISNFLKTAPPVKHEADREALWQGLKDGTISFVTTDHAGCNPAKEKSSKNFWEVYVGIPGAEHRIPFLFSEGFFKGRLTMEETIRLLSMKAAEYFNLPGKGKIEIGYDADLSLINLWDEEVIKAENMHSKGKYTPFEGITFKSIVEKTLVRGKIVADRKNYPEASTGYGQFINIFGK
ncbi:MAG: allantoinase AllB [Ignavibacteriales bacterium]|nr:allantoinase AllB [Ignavibacteriales bacterium]